MIRPLLMFALLLAVAYGTVWATGRAIDHELEGVAEAHGKRGQPLGIRLIHQADHGRRDTWACQAELGIARTRTVWSERRSTSMPYRRWVVRLWRGRAAQCARWRRQLQDPAAAIRATWGSDAWKGIRIASCESGLNPRAVGGGGLYYGMFQFGAYARETYGFGWDALTQARAAYRMWRAEGNAPWPVCGYR